MMTLEKLPEHEVVHDFHSGFKMIQLVGDDVLHGLKIMGDVMKNALSHPVYAQKYQKEGEIYFLVNENTVFATTYYSPLNGFEFIEDEARTLRL